MSVGSVTKCRGCITLSAAVVSPSSLWCGMRNANNVQKSPVLQW